MSRIGYLKINKSSGKPVDPEETERVAVAQVVLRTRQYLAAIYPYDGALIAQMLRDDEEVLKPADVGVTIPKGLANAVRPQELAMAKKLVQGMEMAWSPTEYHDDYRDDLLNLVKRRTKGAKAAKDAPPAPRETKVLDLMEVLRRSVGDRGKTTSRKSRRSA